MDNFKKLLKINKNKALALAVATAMTSSMLVGCKSNAYVDPNQIQEEEEEEDEDGFYNGGYHSSTGYVYRNMFGGKSTTVSSESEDKSKITSKSSSTKKSPLVSKGKSGYSSAKGGSSSS